MSNVADPATHPQTPATPITPPTAPTATDHGPGPNAGTPSAVTPPTAAASTERTFTQAELDSVVKDRLARQRAQLQQEQAQARLEAEAQWQPLAEQHKARVAELEPKVAAYEERIQKYEQRLLAQVKESIKDWPAEAKALIPTDADADTQMAALDKAKPLVAKLVESTAPTPGNPANPRPRTQPGGGERDTETFLRASGRYAAL